MTKQFNPYKNKGPGPYKEEQLQPTPAIKIDALTRMKACADFSEVKFTFDDDRFKLPKFLNLLHEGDLNLKKGPFIAGGSVVRTFSKPVKDRVYDIDIFCCSVEQTNSIHKRMEDLGVYYIGLSNGYGAFTDNWYYEPWDLPIQVVTQKSHSVIDRLLHFDLQNAMMATDGHSILYKHKGVKSSLEGKVLEWPYTLPWQKKRTIERVQKYQSILKELDKQKLSSIR